MISFKQLTLGVGLLVIFAGLQYRLWLEPGGVSDMLKLKKMLAQQVQENAAYQKQNEALLFQVQRLQNSRDAMESRARNELGMVKKGEVFYQILKSDQDASEGKPDENTSE